MKHKKGMTTRGKMMSDKSRKRKAGSMKTKAKRMYNKAIKKK